MKKVLIALFCLAILGCGDGYVRFMNNSREDIIIASVQLYRKPDGTFYVNLSPFKGQKTMTEAEIKAEIVTQLNKHK